MQDKISRFGEIRCNLDACNFSAILRAGLMSQHSCSAELDGSRSTRFCQSRCISRELSELQGAFAG